MPIAGIADRNRDIEYSEKFKRIDRIESFKKYIKSIENVVFDASIHNDRIFYDFSDLNNIKISNQYKKLGTNYDIAKIIATYSAERSVDTFKEYLEIIFKNESGEYVTTELTVGFDDFDKILTPDPNKTILYMNYRNDIKALYIMYNYLKDKWRNFSLDEKEKLLMSVIEDNKIFKFDEESMLDEDKPSFVFERKIAELENALQEKINLSKQLFKLSEEINNVNDGNKIFTKSINIVEEN